MGPRAVQRPTRVEGQWLIDQDLQVALHQRTPDNTCEFWNRYASRRRSEFAPTLRISPLVVVVTSLRAISRFFEKLFLIVLTAT